MVPYLPEQLDHRHPSRNAASSCHEGLNPTPQQTRTPSNKPEAERQPCRRGMRPGNPGPAIVARRRIQGTSEGFCLVRIITNRQPARAFRSVRYALEHRPKEIAARTGFSTSKLAASRSQLSADRFLKAEGREARRSPKASLKRMGEKCAERFSRAKRFSSLKRGCPNREEMAAEA